MIRNRPHSTRSWAAVFVALVLLGAACGKGDDNKKVAANQTTTSVTEASTTTSTEASTTTTVAAATTTSVTAKATTTTKKATTTATTTAPTTTTTVPKLSSDITVLAAASLTEAFTETIAILKQSAHPDAARIWIDYLLTPQGQAVLAKYGFIPAA